MSQKPSIPKGTRDFSPLEMVNRNFIFDTIKSVFQRFGYLPIETPAMENLSTLMGKYGEEGDKLLFKILNSGDFLSNTNADVLNSNELNKIATQICEKGLRYDLTVPFARFVVQHQNDITFPFKRYQIQPVWRADRPQKGRYREFYQCDVDVIGSDSLLNEVELIQILDEVYRALNLNVLVKLNNRKILAGIAEIIGEPDRIIDITIAIDKLDKIGFDKVIEELKEKELSENAINELSKFLKISSTDNYQKLELLTSLLSNSTIGLKGIEEVKTILNYCHQLSTTSEIELDLTLARGLNYYTGAIFEVKSKDVAIGSITGGGRYDDLTGIFGLKDVSGVGISFGADRIYDVMNQLNLFPIQNSATTKLLFANFGAAEEIYALKHLKQIRQNGINAEIYPDTAKIKKQMSYADKKSIPFVAICGEAEMQQNKILLKIMSTGEQQLVDHFELINIIANH